MFEDVFDKLLTGLSAVSVAILIAAVSSWITVHLSLKRFRDEKWWEKKVQAYENLIEALHLLKDSSDTSFDAHITRREIPDDEQKRLQKNSKNAHKEVERTVNIGSFILSEDCHRRLKIFLKEASASSNATDYFTHLDEYGAAINACLEDVLRIARKDLQKP